MSTGVETAAGLHLVAAAGLYAVRASRRLVVGDACMGRSLRSNMTLRVCLRTLGRKGQMFLGTRKTKTHWFMQWSLEQPTNWAMHEAQPAE